MPLQRQRQAVISVDRQALSNQGAGDPQSPLPLLRPPSRISDVRPGHGPSTERPDKAPPALAVRALEARLTGGPAPGVGIRQPVRDLAAVIGYYLAAGAVQEQRPAVVSPGRPRDGSRQRLARPRTPSGLEGGR
jgi:hypothetical protein